MNRYQTRLELTVEVTAFTKQDAEELVEEWFSEGDVPGNPDLYIVDVDTFKTEELR